MPLRFPELRARQRRFLLALALGFAASALVATATSLGHFSGYQGKALDLYFWAQGQTRAPEIVLVGIDEAAFSRLQERQPIPRDYLAGLIRGLRKSGARLIALDVDLRHSTTPAEDRALVSVLHSAPENPGIPVVLARTLSAVPAAGGGNRYNPRPLFDPKLEADSGFAEVPKDDDGFFRRLPLVAPQPDGGAFPSLALAMLARLGGMDTSTLARALAGPEPIGLSLPVWDETRGQFAEPAPLRFFLDDDWKINFIGPAPSFLTIPSDAVYPLGQDEQPVAQDNPFRDRIVLVGATFSASRDAFPTPRGAMHGVEIHASILHTLLTRSYIRPIPWETSLFVQFVLCLGLSGLFTALRSNQALLIALFGAWLLHFTGSIWPALFGSYWFDCLTPIVAIRLSCSVHEAMERRRIRRSFHQHVGREVADRIYSDDPSLAGQRRTVSILFSDLRDYTTLSEGLSPAEVAQQLNEYLPMAVEAVTRHRGIVIDFFGDAVMAVYGAPLDNPDHALDAVRTGLGMQAGLEALNATWQARGLHALRLGIGIHTGSVFAGTVGSEQRKKYAVVGDAVNVASRVEGLNKVVETTLLITEETYGAIMDKVEARDRGELKLKGRQQAVRVYEVLGLIEAAMGPAGRLSWWRDGESFWWPWLSSPRRRDSPDKSQIRSPS